MASRLDARRINTEIRRRIFPSSTKQRYSSCRPLDRFAYQDWAVGSHAASRVDIANVGVGPCVEPFVERVSRFDKRSVSKANKVSEPRKLDVATSKLDRNTRKQFEWRLHESQIQPLSGREREFDSNIHNPGRRTPLGNESRSHKRTFQLAASCSIRSRLESYMTDRDARISVGMRFTRDLRATRLELNFARA